MTHSPHWDRKSYMHAAAYHIPHMVAQHNNLKQVSGQGTVLVLLYYGTQITVKVKSDHRSKFSNLSHWKEEA